MSRPHVLITKRVFPEAIALLDPYAELDYISTDDGLTPAELLEHARGKQIILSQLTDRLSRDAITQMPDVKMIAQIAVGYDNIDVAAASAAGVLVSNTPGVLTDTTADLAFALLLAAARRIAEGHNYIHAGRWKRWTIDLMMGHDVHHRTLGIFGMGRIGQAVARRGAGFSMRVLYHNRTRLTPDIERELNAEHVPLDRLLAESDFISIHASLSDATRHLIGEPQLRMMKRDAILVNTARGQIVDEPALARALREKWIAAAGLDVFEHEPDVHPDLLACENAVLAPHVGSASVATRTKMTVMAAENALAALAGRRPPNLLNPEIWETCSFQRAAGG